MLFAEDFVNDLKKKKVSWMGCTHGCPENEWTVIRGQLKPDFYEERGEDSFRCEDSNSSSLL